jgi:hypothetical protein
LLRSLVESQQFITFAFNLVLLNEVFLRKKSCKMIMDKNKNVESEFNAEGSLVLSEGRSQVQLRTRIVFLFALITCSLFKIKAISSYVLLFLTMTIFYLEGKIMKKVWIWYWACLCYLKLQKIRTIGTNKNEKSKDFFR